MMTFPAFQELVRDRSLTWRVRSMACALYEWLEEKHPSAFYHPFALKSHVLAGILSVRRATAAGLLKLLIERGYLLDHGTLPATHVRLIQVPFVRRPPDSCIPNRTGQQAA